MMRRIVSHIGTCPEGGGRHDEVLPRGFPDLLAKDEFIEGTVDNIITMLPIIPKKGTKVSAISSL